MILLTVIVGDDLITAVLDDAEFAAPLASTLPYRTLTQARLCGWARASVS
jgi:hypothetical protein